MLDEITSALDESNKHNVNEMIHRYVREQKYCRAVGDTR